VDSSLERCAAHAHPPAAVDGREPYAAAQSETYRQRLLQHLADLQNLPVTAATAAAAATIAASASGAISLVAAQKDGAKRLDDDEENPEEPVHDSDPPAP
jgi:hypothetical protein